MTPYDHLVESAGTLEDEALEGLIDALKSVRRDRLRDRAAAEAQELQGVPRDRTVAKNLERSERVRKTLEFYKNEMNGSGITELNLDIEDLLVDLHHFVLSNKAMVRNPQEAIDAIDNLLVTAVEHFLDELPREQ